jgi:hypothetical protein
MSAPADILTICLEPVTWFGKPRLCACAAPVCPRRRFDTMTDFLTNFAADAMRRLDPRSSVAELPHPASD